MKGLAQGLEWLLAHLNMAAQTRLAHLLTSHDDASLLLFALLRATLAGLYAGGELLWLGGLSKHMRRSAVCWTAVVLLTVSGLHHAAGAYLPSATWMLAWVLCSTAALWHQPYWFIVLAVGATLTTGWPFGVALLLPMALRLLWLAYEARRVRGVVALLAWAVLCTIVIQAAVMWIDYQYYGRWVSPTLNIVGYNAGAGGDALYGVESPAYYIKNLALNLNVVAPLGYLGPMVVYFSQRRNVDVLMTILPIYVWTLLTFGRPHKEERFLFPMYPILCLSAVLFVEALVNAIGRIEAGLSRHKQLRRRQRAMVHASLWIPSVLLSLARTTALMRYYAAPLEAFGELRRRHAASEASSSMVCVGGEWYRFPSSFYLAPDMQLGFLPSSFQGQLPQPFSEFGSRTESKDVLQPFNDRNQHEPSRYVSLDACDWIIDLDSSDLVGGDFVAVADWPFLDADRTLTLHRVLYLPYWHERAMEQGNVHYHRYTLYQRHATLNAME